MDKKECTSMAINIDTEADYVLEAYRDYESEESESMQLTEMLQLRDKLIELYRCHPDGEVIVELTIRQEFVNV
jgi:hypothetical protein